MFTHIDTQGITRFGRGKHETRPCISPSPCVSLQSRASSAAPSLPPAPPHLTLSLPAACGWFACKWGGGKRAPKL